jgi:uncharacterized protein involved in exopolysaccharide biosynthesis
MTALDARAHLIKLQAERALAQRTGVGDIPAYMAELQREIEASRSVYVGAAVTEIASLRAELFEPQVG